MADIPAVMSEPSGFRLSLWFKISLIATIVLGIMQYIGANQPPVP